ncbi:MAG: NUDIX domain-containing protein [Rhodobacteraceae bacterium]|nr:NUDIX domain-containing protein [Paracoccaceae bacterium]
MSDYACALIVEDGRLLLGRRTALRRHRAGLWDVLGGLAEPEEDLHAALRRELQEEIGVTPTAQRYFATIDKPASSVCYHFFVVDRWLGSPEIRNNEHAELRWFHFGDAADLADLALPEYGELFRRLARFSSGADTTTLR